MGKLREWARGRITTGFDSIVAAIIAFIVATLLTPSSTVPAPPATSPPSAETSWWPMVGAFLMRWGLPVAASLGVYWLGRWRARTLVERERLAAWPMARVVTFLSARSWEGYQWYFCVHPEDQLAQGFAEVTNWSPRKVVLDISGMTIRTSDEGDVFQVPFAKPKRLGLEPNGGTESFNAGFALAPAAMALMRAHQQDHGLRVLLHCRVYIRAGDDMTYDLEFRTYAKLNPAKLDYKTGPALDWPEDDDKLSA
jgi:hypothetical protein